MVTNILRQYLDPLGEYLDMLRVWLFSHHLFHTGLQLGQHPYVLRTVLP